MSAQPETVTPPGSSAFDAERAGRPHPGYGWLLFAGIIFLVDGALNVIYGIAATANSRFFVHGARYVFGGLRSWGWVMIILGALEILAAFSLFRGGLYGRVFGLIVAGASAIGALLAIPAYPALSLAVFAIDLLIVYGLASYGLDDDI